MRTLMNDLHMAKIWTCRFRVLNNAICRTAHQTSRSERKIPLKQRAPAAGDNEIRPINLNVVSGTVIITICRCFHLLLGRVENKRLNCLNRRPFVTWIRFRDGYQRHLLTNDLIVTNRPFKWPVERVRCVHLSIRKWMIFDFLSN
jgi:hypothetical protein